MLVINLIIYYLYYSIVTQMNRQSEFELQLRQNEYNREQLRLIHDMNEQTRAKNHDMRNYMSHLYALLKEQNSAEAVHYAELLLNTAVNEELSDTGNHVLDSILNYKLAIAKQKQIQINRSIRIPQSIEMEAIDLCGLIGNLLDNAIEATEQLPEPRPPVELAIRYDMNQLHIHVKNACTGQIVFDPDGLPVTNKADQLNHGHGLKNIDRIIHKYQGVMDIHMEEQDGQHFFVLSSTLFK